MQGRLAHNTDSVTSKRGHACLCSTRPRQGSLACTIGTSEAYEAAYPLPQLDGMVFLISPLVIAIAAGLFVIGRDVLTKPSFSKRNAMVNSNTYEAIGISGREEGRVLETQSKQVLSILRIGVPSFLAALLGLVYFDELSLSVSSMLDTETRDSLGLDSGQFIQNFLTAIDLLFAILAGNTYAALYQQQVAIYMALFGEVSVARSLLEQLTLVGSARSWYPLVLQYLQDYISNDLRRLDIPPVKQLSRSMNDPLESIMYITSVGEPSIVYETVEDLRRARGVRLGALQRKFPVLGMTLLYLLAAVELLAFPLLAAGTADNSELGQQSTVSILELQSLIFASVCGCLVLVLRIIQELWQSAGGVFNVDEVLQQMTFGLEEELKLRIQANMVMATKE